jgi:uncharacterized phage-associated protein
LASRPAVEDSAKGVENEAMSSLAPYDATAIANLLLDLADERNLKLTQMSLLKLLYFAHGWYLSSNNKPLLIQEFEAWQYGPVIKVVRDEFKDFESRSITRRATKLNILTNERLIVEPKLSSEDRLFVLSIFDFYQVYDAWQLSEMTHEPESPWDRIWNSESPIGRLALRIENDDIKAHFDGLPNRLGIY